MPPLEVGHEVDQRAHALDRHGVVKAGAHAADRPVAREVRQAGGFGLGQEVLVQLRPREPEPEAGDVPL